MDFIESFMEYTDGANSPEVFRLWAGIATVCGAMERRVATYTAQGPIYPNQYILLVATPGVGKTEAIKPITKLWNSTKKLHVAADSLTAASIIDSLAQAGGSILLPSKELFTYHSLSVAADELGVFLNAYEMDFLSKLTKLYDNPDFFRERRRHFNGGKELQIEAPQLNMICGAQPGFLATLLPDYAWSQGFMSRFILIYSDKRPIIDLFTKRVEKVDLRKRLEARLKEWVNLKGDFAWESSVVPRLQGWYAHGCPPAPTHSRLTHYSARRLVHIIKLCMVSAISRDDELIIRDYDFDRSMEWLLTAEKAMPDVFRSMEGRSDASVLDDLHNFMVERYIKTKEKIHESTIINFLANRTTSDKLEKILSIALKSGQMDRVATTDGKMYYVPRDRQNHGRE